jgi:hypothetical protein
MPTKEIDLVLDSTETERLLHNLDAIQQAIFVAIVDAADEVVKFIAGEAATKDAPIKTGHLRDSIDYEVQANSGDGLEVRAIAAARTAYALAQHENLDYNHPIPPNTGDSGARYLSRPAEQNLDRIQKICADRVSAAIAGMSF